MLLENLQFLSTKILFDPPFYDFKSAFVRRPPTVIKIRPFLTLWTVLIVITGPPAGSLFDCLVEFTITHFKLFRPNTVFSYVRYTCISFIKKIRESKIFILTFLINGPVLRSNNFSWGRVRSNNFGQNLSF